MGVGWKCCMEVFFPLLKIINNILVAIIIMIMIMPEEFCLRGDPAVEMLLWVLVLPGSVPSFGISFCVVLVLLQTPVRWEFIPKRSWKGRDLLRERDEQQKHKTPVLGLVSRG